MSYIGESVFALSDLENVAILLIQRTTTQTLHAVCLCGRPFLRPIRIAVGCEVSVVYSELGLPQPSR